MLNDPQRAPAAWVLQARLQGEHLTHAQRETLGQSNARLNLAGRSVARVQNRSELVPALRRSGLDKGGDRPVEQKRKEESRSDGLVGEYARVRILQTAHHELL